MALSESIFLLQWCLVCEPAHSKRFDEEKSKCASLALERSGHWALSASLHESLWCTYLQKKPESKQIWSSHTTCSVVFLWSAHHNNSSRWFAISSPQLICWPQFSSMGGVAKKYITKTWMWKILLQQGHILRSNGWRCSSYGKCTSPTWVSHYLAIILHHNTLLYRW